MITRRTACACAAFGMALTTPIAARAATECLAYDKDRQQATTPAQAMERLREGNERFVSDASINCDLLEQVHQTATGQSPFAAIVGCIDSRVPPELVFDQRIGHVFVARIAGNFVDTEILGSLEFATAVAGAKAILVLGHSECGAVKGAIDGVDLGLLTATLSHIRPAVAEAGALDASSSDPAVVQAVAEANVRLAVDMTIRSSAVIAGLVARDELIVAGAMHDVSTGRVTFL